MKSVQSQDYQLCMCVYDYTKHPVSLTVELAELVLIQD